MTASPDNKNLNPASGNEIFEQILTLNTQGIDLLLVNMFDQLAEADNWGLPEKERNRLIEQMDNKKRIIKSSFVFQLKKNFTDFKAIRRTRLHENISSDWHALGLVGVNERDETKALESIISRYEARYETQYQSMAKRLGHCVNRSRTELHDNPMHVKKLYESFQYSIDSLGLETRHKISLYQIFADTVIERLEPLYNSIEQCFIEHNVLPDIKPMSKKPPTQELNKEPASSNSVAMSRIPVLMGIFQTFKEKSGFSDGNYRNLFPELKTELKQRDIPDFDHLLDRLATKFELIFSDEDLPDRIKSQIARLQIYLFMSSIQESDLLKRSSNPARRLLDTVVRTEVDFAVDDQEDLSGFGYLRDQIDQISNNPFIESQAYARLLDGYVRYTSVDSELKSESTEKTEPKPVPVAIVPDPEPEHKIESQPKPEAQAKVEPEPKTETNDEPEPEPKIEVKFEPEPESQPGPELETEARIEPEVVEKKNPEKPVSMVEAVVKAISAAVPSKSAKTDNSENIYAVVQSIVNDMTLPLRVQGRSTILFDEVWSPLLHEVARTKGFKSPAWQKIMTIAKTQVWVLTPKSTEEDLDKLVSATAQIENSLSQSMQSLKLSVDQQASLLEFLEHEQVDVIAQTRAAIEDKQKASSESKKAAQIDEPEFEAEKHDEKINLADTIDEFSDIMDTGRFDSSDDMLKVLDEDKDEADSEIPDAENIHKSDWIEIKKGNSTILAKLTWKSADNSQFIFVDRDGNRVCEISNTELNKELKAGTISLISSIPASSQRAAFSVIQTIK